MRKERAGGIHLCQTLFVHFSSLLRIQKFNRSVRSHKTIHLMLFCLLLVIRIKDILKFYAHMYMSHATYTHFLRTPQEAGLSTQYCYPNSSLHTASAYPLVVKMSKNVCSLSPSRSSLQDEKEFLACYLGYLRAHIQEP